VEKGIMSKDMTEQIKSILTSLLSLTRDDIGRKSNIAFSLREFKDDFVRLYEEDGIIASLTHSVLCNKGSAHSFCIALHSLEPLWDFKEVQLSFAEGLRKGDSLLIDGISFLPKYRLIPEIQEAIAYNISTCSSILFQINMCPGLGLANVPSIKQAIIDRKSDIIRMIENNWYESSLIANVPYLMEDKDVSKVYFDMKPKFLQALKQDKSW